MMKVLGIVLMVMFCTIVVIAGIGAVFLNLFDRIDDERPEEEI